MHSDQFIEEMKQNLLETKARLEQELAARPIHMEIDTDMEAQQDEAEQDFENQGVRAQLEADLKKVDAALAKIENGTYGVDDEGNQISEERLRALPWADKDIQ